MYVTDTSEDGGVCLWQIQVRMEVYVTDTSEDGGVYGRHK